MIRALLDRLDRKVRLMVGRCVLKLLTDTNPSQVVKVDMYKGETRDEVERLQDYGWTSIPLEGAQGLVVFCGGDRAHGAVVKMDDRRYRPTKLKPGDVKIYTDKDKEQGHSIYLKSDDRKITVRCKDLVIEADESITITAGKGISVTAGDDIVMKGANIRLN